MDPVYRKIRLVFFLLPALALAACVDVTGPGDADEEPTLRIHDVSALQVEDLDTKLNRLLEREDLALRGQVELIDDHRLAVNGTARLQREIEQILVALQNGTADNDEAIERPFRIQFWLLSMSQELPHKPLPAGLDEVVEPIAAEFPGFGFEVQDFLESFHDGPAHVQHLTSGAGTNVHFRQLRTTSEGVSLRARVHAVASSPSPLRHRPAYSVNQSLRPAQPLVLGRAHGGGKGEEAVYQVLIARMDWTD